MELPEGFRIPSCAARRIRRRGLESKPYPRPPQRRNGTRLRVSLVAATIAAVPIVSFAQHRDLTHGQPAVPDAAVDFGVLSTAPLGPAPCLQTGAIGGPTDPCSYKIHHLTPEEVTILKGGEVTFQIHGGGHAMAIYEVSKDTTRDELGQFL